MKALFFCLEVIFTQTTLNIGIPISNIVLWTNENGSNLINIRLYKKQHSRRQTGNCITVVVNDGST